MEEAVDKQILIENSSNDWCLFQVALPLLMILLTWPLAGLVIGTEHSFFKAFAGSDLLLFSAMLLAGAGVELGRRQIKESRFSIKLIHRNRSNILWFFAVPLFCWFSIVKMDMMREDFFKNGILPLKIYIYVVINFFSVIGSTGLSMVTLWEENADLLEQSTK